MRRWLDDLLRRLGYVREDEWRRVRLTVDMVRQWTKVADEQQVPGTKMIAFWYRRGENSDSYCIDGVEMPERRG
jgi:hypothetical protein